MITVRPWLVLPVLAVLAAPSRPSPRVAPPPLTLHDCHLPRVDITLRCGAYQVFENRTTKRGRTIKLRVVVAPAIGPDRRPDPVFFIAGGPGGSAVAGVGSVVHDSTHLRDHRDLVFVDQRGSAGESHPLNCDFYGPPDSLQSYLGDFLPPDAVRRCRDQLARTSDLTQYTTSIAMDDLDDVRAALGYERINLVGGSYGTRAALVFARQHPSSVRTLTLQGIVPPTVLMPQHFARDAQQSLDGVLADCEQDAQCHAAFPDLRADVTKVFERLRSGPVPVTVTDSRTHARRTVQLPYDMVAETVRYMLYVSAGASYIPVAMHEAASGNFTWLAEQSLDARGAFSGKTGTFDGLYIAITCAEDLPWFNADSAAVEARGTFLGDYRVRQQHASCDSWPRSPIPTDFRQPVRSDAPVLLLSGSRDPVTPASQGIEALRTLPHALHVIVPYGGHDPDGLEGLSCLDGLQRTFIEQASVAGLDTSCVARIKRPPWPTTLPAATTS